jgi:outer membrane protein
MPACRTVFCHLMALVTIGWGIGLLNIGSANAQTPTGADEFPLRIDGDVGLGAYYTRSIIRGKTEPANVLPYGYFDYGRMFARIDTLGVKTVKVGYGYLELVGRVSLDGFKADNASLKGLTDRKNPVPLGIGTFQQTPVGAFFINAFHDFNKSEGNLFEAIYVGKLETPRLTIYPQLGAEYLSQQYVGYYYGVSAQEATTSAYGAYRPGGAFNPFVAALIDVKVTDEWHLNFYARHKWLASSIRDSSIVGRNTMDSAFVALSYRFK